MKFKDTPRAAQQVTDVDGLIEALAVARGERDLAQQKVTNLERDLIELMESRQQKSVTGNTVFGKFQATYVRRTTVEVDEAGLRKSLGAKVYDKYTDSRLNRRRLEQALEAGEVEVTAVSPFVSEKVGAAHLRWTEKKDGDDA